MADSGRVSEAAPADRTARLGAAIAGGGGLLLIASLFLPWYTLPGADLGGTPIGDVVEEIGGAVGVDVRDAVTRSGWESFEVIDVFCLAAGIVAVARAAAALLGESDDPAVPGSVLTGALGGLALVLVLYRVVDPPLVGLDRELGLWIGLFAAAGIVYGSYLAYQAVRRPV